MKQLNFFRLGVTYAGAFIGAGLVSGQELWQFFGAYGKWGIAGLVLTIALFFLFGVLLLRFAQKSGIEEMDQIIIPWRIPALRVASSAAAMVLLFGVYVIMAAGAGSLLQQTLGLPRAVGGGLFCLLVLAVSFKGIHGVITAFSWFVPILVIGSVGLSLLVLWQNGLPEFSAGQTSDNPLLGSFWFSSVTYLSYNFFGAIGLLASLHRMIPKRSTVYTGVGFGCLVLFLIAGSILAAIAAVPGASAADLPMLTVAMQVHSAVGILYAVLLLGGMFGASAVSMVAILTYTGQKFPRWKPSWQIPLLSLGAWIGSLAGFGDLIGIVYPVFGYVGFVALVGIVICAIRWRKVKKEVKTA